MALSVKELPESERPYEKAMMYGINNLSNAELLSIIIKNGTKDENSIQIANRLLNLVDSMEQFRNLDVIDFKQVKGIGTVKAIQLLAVCEIAKRMFVPINNTLLDFTISVSSIARFSADLTTSSNFSGFFTK